jgi:hypothetical protein
LDAFAIAAVREDKLSRKDFVAAINRAFSKLLPQLANWVYHAPFGDILNLRAPSAEALQGMAGSAPPQKEVCNQYRWIIDRLTDRPVARWITSSLEMEYQWRRGNEVANLPAEALGDIDIDTEAIAMEIADRQVSRRGAAESDPLAAQVKEKAKDFLRQGRYSDGAALFEFIGDLSDLRKADCLNDRGFCWIPEDPKRALYFLQQASARKYSPPAVNVYNQMCCKMALGELAGARTIADYYWVRQYEERPVWATLWRRDGDGWRLEDTPDARECVAELALAVAESEGWPERIAKWRERLEALRSTGEHIV